MFSHQKVLETEKIYFQDSRTEKRSRCSADETQCGGARSTPTPAHAGGSDVRRDVTPPATGSGTETKRDKLRINFSRECQLASPEIQGSSYATRFCGTRREAPSISC